ncbi:hypothetical protein NDU88_005847 [Pleurodeles waltl]|uniref:Uncharacterized protein n=1 Tax=Pleurodeles waltl TaxID=8319 RepID=A0AAV7TDT4_PLEWA|nr:hypothetical protein NDU88_005847 [Pleurodeles waltl]
MLVRSPPPRPLNRLGTPDLEGPAVLPDVGGGGRPRGALRNRKRPRLDCCARGAACPGLVPAHEVRSGPCCDACPRSSGQRLGRGRGVAQGQELLGRKTCTGSPALYWVLDLEVDVPACWAYPKGAREDGGDGGTAVLQGAVLEELAGI